MLRTSSELVILAFCQACATQAITGRSRGSLPQSALYTRCTPFMMRRVYHRILLSWSGRQLFGFRRRDTSDVGLTELCAQAKGEDGRGRSLPHPRHQNGISFPSSPPPATSASTVPPPAPPRLSTLALIAPSLKASFIIAAD